MATIRDVARAAGVSIATVSRVFNSSSRVNERTAQRVWLAADDLDYWPNAAARSLTTNRTHVLGILLPDLYGEFFSEVIRGIDQAASLEDYQILISSSHARTEDLIAAARSMSGRIDGLIMMVPDQDSADAARSIRHKISDVLLNPAADFHGCCSVSIANFAGAEAAVTHLLSLGHRRIAMVTGPAGNIDSEERRRGYRQSLASAGLADDPALEIDGDFTEQAGYEAALQILTLEPRPTAVFAANDSMAVGLLSALRDAGVSIPGDMAVVGFDDISIARYLSPPLTTVHVDAYELGRRAVQLLLASLHSPDPDALVQEVMPATLVVRRSCGATHQEERPVLAGSTDSCIAEQQGDPALPAR